MRQRRSATVCEEWLVGQVGHLDSGVYYGAEGSEYGGRRGKEKKCNVRRKGRIQVKR